MKLKPTNIINQKLIGFHVKIIPANETFPKWEGKIIDETYNLFILDHNEKIKKIPKKGNRFQFQINEEIIEVNGKLFIGRPENRIKMKRKY